MKTFSFDVDDAKKYGTDGAIFLYNLRYWLHVQRDKKHNFKDGRYWAYWTNKDLRRIFPFWSDQNLKTIKNNLVKKNAIRKGCYNKIKYDKTTWFTLHDDIYDLEHDEQGDPVEKQTQSSVESNVACSKCNATDSWNQPTEKIELTNRSADSNQPIPNDLNNNLKDNLNIDMSGSPPDASPPIVVDKFDDYDAVAQVIEYLNIKCKRNYDPTKKASRKYIEKVLARGNSLEDCKDVIDHFAVKWSGPKMSAFLRPSTLFNEKFEERVEDLKATPGEYDNFLNEVEHDF